MAKGSVRKKGKKWYYRYYVEEHSIHRKHQLSKVQFDELDSTKRLIGDKIEIYLEIGA